jgi:hypothetical protein
MPENISIDKYSVRYSCGNDGGWQAVIELYDSIGTHKAELLFYREGINLVKPSWKYGDSFMVMHFRLSQFSDILNIIRKHKISVEFDEKKQHAFINPAFRINAPIYNIFRRPAQAAEQSSQAYRSN